MRLKNQWGKMIRIFFGFANEKVLITIRGNNVTFSQTSFGAIESQIEGLRLDYQGCCREYPDLETRSDWREETIKRFKEKIKGLQTEREVANYLMEDLKPFGYVPELIQRDGHRPIKIK